MELQNADEQQGADILIESSESGKLLSECERRPSASSSSTASSISQRRQKTQALSGTGTSDNARRQKVERVTQAYHSVAGHLKFAAARSFLLAKLALRLAGYLGFGLNWFTKFLWLMLYAFILMPGFVQAMWYYFLSPRVLRDIQYGDQARNFLDIYLPDPPAEESRPVVVFVTGGAWIIGYKAWGALLGQSFEQCNIVAVSLDYRNFPQGCVADMVEDVSTGIGWVLANIEKYGGDPNRVFVVGQSAGAHLSALAIIRQAVQDMKGLNDEMSEEVQGLTWRSARLRGCIGISGCYNLKVSVQHFHERGLHRKLFFSMMGGKDELDAYSPEAIIMSHGKMLAPFLPHFWLFHGTADISIPHSHKIF